MPPLRLKVLEGSLAGQILEVQPGQPFLIGRGAEAALSVPGDGFLSARHAILEEDSGTWRLTDLGSSNGTLWNGVRSQVAVLEDGDRVKIGATLLEVESGATQPRAPTPQEKLIRYLRDRPEVVLALVDAAQSPDVWALMRDTREPHLSLFTGEDGERLKEFAPYLVGLTGNDGLLESLVYAGWGKAWASYLTTSAPFAEVHRHLRSMLMVDTEAGKKVYFRFYDPRVLRTYLPTCEPQELPRVFGHTRRFMIESEDPAVALEFTLVNGELQRQEVRYEELEQG
jgi:pSer/pThr/pTyr-binding forkhead associated (FHA) protein